MKQARLQKIEQYIQARGTCTFNELSEVFNVSKITVRRDVEELCNQGLVSKVYGGAMYNKPNAADASSTPESIEAKSKIAKLAVDLVEDGDSLFFDSGSTVAQMVPLLGDKKNLIILTNSLEVMTRYLKNEQLNVICFGGKLQHTTGSLAGTIQGHFHCSKAFISAQSISQEHGAGNTSFYDGVTKRVAIENSDKAYLLVDHSKFTASAFNIFAKAKDFTAIITNTKPPEKFIDYCDLQGIELLY